MTTHPSAADRTDNPYRKLWAAVLSAAISEYQLMHRAAARGCNRVNLAGQGIALPGGSPAEKVLRVQIAARRYLCSADGRAVCEMAGLQPCNRLTDAILAAIQSPKKFVIKSDREDRDDDE